MTKLWKGSLFLNARINVKTSNLLMWSKKERIVLKIIPGDQIFFSVTMKVFYSPCENHFVRRWLCEEIYWCAWRRNSDQKYLTSHSIFYPSSFRQLYRVWQQKWLVFINQVLVLYQVMDCLFLAYIAFILWPFSF